MVADKEAEMLSLIEERAAAAETSNRDYEAQLLFAKLSSAELRSGNEASAVGSHAGQ